MEDGRRSRQTAAAAAWTNHDFYLTEGSTNKFSALLHECDSEGREDEGDCGANQRAPATPSSAATQTD